MHRSGPGKKGDLISRRASGPFQLSPGVGSGDYADSPVHRYYQMYQQLDCNVSYATKANPSGCHADLFPWVEVAVSAGTNGSSQPPNFNDETTLKGATSMGFCNVEQGDAPYFKQRAGECTLLDNYHRPAMGGTGLDSLYRGFADGAADRAPQKKNDPGVRCTGVAHGRQK